MLEKRLVIVLDFLDAGPPGSPEIVCDIVSGLQGSGDSSMVFEEFICFGGTKWIGEAEVELLVIQSLGIFGPSLPGHQKSRLNLHYC